MKALGVSERRGLERLALVQAYYSLAGRDLEHEIVPMAEDQNLGLMIWSPLAAGFLSGHYDRHSETTASRRDKFQFPPIDREKTLDIIDVLKGVAQRHDVSGSRSPGRWPSRR